MIYIIYNNTTGMILGDMVLRNIHTKKHETSVSDVYNQSRVIKIRTYFTIENGHNISLYQIYFKHWIVYANPSNGPPTHTITTFINIFL